MDVSASPVLQVAVGAAITMALFVMAYTIVGDGGTSEPNPNKPVEILSGVTDMSSLRSKRFATDANAVPTPNPIVHLPASVNRLGGAQFSYTWWMKLSDVSPHNVAQKTLFLRGDPRRYPLRKVDVSSGESMLPSSYTTQIVKAPLVRFGRTHEELIVDINTTLDLEQSFTTAFGASDMGRKHLQLMTGRWVMFTIVFQDHVPIDDFEDGILMQMYVNDVTLVRKTARGALRLNNGDMCFLPNDEAIRGGFLADFAYYPWALSRKEIQQRFRKGPSKGCTRALQPRETTERALILADDH